MVLLCVCYLTLTITARKKNIKNPPNFKTGLESVQSIENQPTDTSFFYSVGLSLLFCIKE